MPDLKYIAAILIGIAGLTATIWYANAPITSKSLSLSIKSISPLNIVGETELPGLKILVDDKEVIEPALTVLILENNGATPVRSSDFESDIEILLGKEVQPIRAAVVSSRPEKLVASLSVTNSRVLLEPLLLNLEDNVTINILSNGLPKTLDTTSRIAGIKEIELIESADSKKENIRAFILITAAFLVAIPTICLFSPTKPWPPVIVPVRRRLWLCVVLALMVFAIGLAVFGLDLIGIDSGWRQLFSIYAIFILAIPLAYWLHIDPENQGSSSESA